MKRQRATRYYSSRQEKAVAKAIGGRTIVNSGATPFQKGDVATNDFSIECKTKTTRVSSHSIKKEWIDKQKIEALSMGKSNWALAFNYGPNEENYYIISEKMFGKLIEYMSQEE